MERPILIRGARQLLTLRGSPGPRRGLDMNALGVVSDGSVLIVGGRIREAGSTRRVENLALARNAHEIPAEGRVVMPGFVDVSVHLEAAPTAKLALALARRVLRLSLLHGTTTWGVPSADTLERKLARALAKLDPSKETIVPLPATDTAILLPLAGVVDARPLVREGRAVAIATGYHAVHQKSCNMAMAIAAACDCGLTIAEAIVASTINAAYALGIGDRSGSLEAGKQADILILDTPDHRDLALARGLNLVHSVMKHGEMIAEVAD
ncbi:MAG: amidohydrolase family protein [Bryobacteraceae bacterium]